jgi:hypothetical protein
MKPKKDPFTGEEFFPKRTNQVYANRANQTAHNNRRARESREENKVMRKALDKNLKVLKRILGEKKEVIVSEDFLRGAEFDLKLFTQYSRSPDDLSVFHNFNHSITRLKDKNYKILKNA